MNDEGALLKAIIAYPDEDTPRLAYADWLEEHGDPDRAAFIRVQCGYTAASPTQREYPEFQEGLWLTYNLCQRWLKAHRPELPAVFDFADESDYEHYRRGFFHSVRGAWHRSHREPDENELASVCTELAHLTSTTTIRKLSLPYTTHTQLARIVEAPGADQLSGLVVGPYWRTEGDEMARIIASADSLRRLQQLFLHFVVSASGARALAGAKFERLEYCDLPGLECEPDDVTELFGAKWFRSLMQMRCNGFAQQVMRPLLAALSELPRLEHLSLEVAHPPDANTFPGTRGFRELAQLFLWGAHAQRAVDWLVRSRMPKLIELLISGLSNTTFRKLRAAKWFPQLWMLDLRKGALTDRSITLLARSNLPELRILQLGDNQFGRDGLMALADGARLPSMTTLDLNSSFARALEPGAGAEFGAALNRPGLRNLWLDYWPIGEAGAQALAANPRLSNLVCLSLNYCGIGNAGLDALIRSPHLRNLVGLGVAGNDVTRIAALLDSSRLPRLKALWIQGNRILPATVAKLRAARDWAVENTDE